ncbi:MAG: hypothetical protein K8T91_25365 [Planctomycetes bacterium]|nr:hypothetical protein [Planctomycetota bacterium]
MNHAARRTRLTLIGGLLFLTLARPCQVTAADAALSGYANYKTLAQQVSQLAKSELVTQSSLGRTLGGREIYLLSIGKGRKDQKPALLVLGNVEAAQLVGSEMAMRIARSLTEKSAADPATRELLDRFTVYVIPRPNPDGSEKCWEQPLREPTGNKRPTDDDRDGKIGEDGPADLNGDGLITMMRVEDDRGEYIAHPKDPRVMIKADPKKNERGKYRLLVEGRDKDQDEKFSEDGSAGVSFNRNFTFNYPYYQTGAGPHQVSEIETRAVADFAFNHPNIVAVLTFTPEDNLVRPWKPDAGSEGQPAKTRLLTADAAVQDQLAEMYRKLRSDENAPDSPGGAGSFSDWAYFHYGRWSLAARAWWMPKVDAPAAAPEEKKPADKEVAKGDKSKSSEAAATKPADDSRGADQLVALAWFAKEKIDGFVEFKPIKHPDFPDKTVEVGGFKPLVRLNPSAKQLDDLGQKHASYVLEVLGKFPRIAIRDVKTEPLGAGVHRITVRVANDGLLPTSTEMGRIAQQNYPVQVKMELPEKTEFLKGAPRMAIDRLEGNGGTAERTWLVRLPNDQPTNASIRVSAPSIGVVETKVELK